MENKYESNNLPFNEEYEELNNSIEFFEPPQYD